MKLILYGDPRTKKNSSRIIMCGSYPKLLPSKQYKAYEKDCLKQITGKYKKSIDKPCNMKCIYFMKTKRKVDLVNLLSATCDILVNAKVIADDNSKIIVSHDGSRVKLDRKLPRVEIDITTQKEEDKEQ